MKLNPLSFLAAFGLVCALATPSFAHPHVWVTVETEIVLGPNQEITGFRHKWTFDEFYTQFAIDGLDTNNDGIYSTEELAPLAKTNVEALKEFEYFTFPTIDGKKIPLKEPADYHLEYEDKLLTLYFTLPLEAPVQASLFKNFQFSVYDPGFYVSLTFADKSPVKFSSAKLTKCKPRFVSPKSDTQVPLSQAVGENIDPSSNFGSKFAQKVSLDCKD